MELRQLRYFVVAAETLNIRKASEILFISQPGLSKSIAELEQSLNVTLFERDRGRLRLLPAGQYLLDEARKLLMDADRVVAEIRRYGSQNAAISIGIEDNVAETWHMEYSAALRHLRQSNPNTSVSIHTTTLADTAEHIQTGRIDLGIILHHDIASLNVKHHLTLGEDRLGVLCRDPPRGNTPEAFREFLGSVNLIVLDHDVPIYSHFQNICRELDCRSKNIRMVKTNVALLMTELQDEVAVISRRLAERRMRPGQRFCEFPAASAALSVCAVWNADAVGPAARDLRDGFQSAEK